MGDEGGQAIVKNMIKNKTLCTLNLASNDMTEATAPALSEVLMNNIQLACARLYTSHVTFLDVNFKQHS